MLPISLSHRGQDSNFRPSRFPPTLDLNRTIIAGEESRYNVKVFSIEIHTVGCPVGLLDGKPVIVTKGEHNEVLKPLNGRLGLARDVALNPLEAEALTHLIKYNETGNIREHLVYSESRSA
jgi:hypothetical protein